MSVSYPLQVLARETAKRVKQFYQNPENVRKFEEWRKNYVLEKEKDANSGNAQ